MATVYSTQYQSAWVNEPSERLDAGFAGARIYRAYAEFTADGELSSGDVIKMMRLPANARFVDARIISPDWGTTGSCNVGYTDADGGSVNVDVDAFFASLDTNTAAVDSKLAGTAAGFNVKVTKDVDIIITAAADSTALDGLTIGLEIEFVIN